MVEVTRACYVRDEEFLISGLVFYFSLVKDKKKKKIQGERG